MNEQKLLTTIEGFAKANPEIVEQLRKSAHEIINLWRSEMTAKELDSAKVAFCLGGVWVIINRVNIINP